MEIFTNPDVIVNGSVYTGKPLAYLDQNIISVLTGKEMNDITYRLRDEYQVVYSNENLEEIKRSGNKYYQKQLDVLKDLNAHYIRLIQGFFLNVEVRLDAEVTVNDSYKEYCNVVAKRPLLHTVNLLLIHKYFGGAKDYSFEDIEKLRMLALSELKTEHPKLAETLLLVEGINKKDGTDKKNDKNWKGFKIEMSGTSMTPMHLNNTKGPDILEKIWERFVMETPNISNNPSLDEFFGFNATRELFLFQKISILYNILNALGYYSNPKIDKEDKFTSELSDIEHAYTASIASVLFSNDKNFYKKCKAIYEYLNIPTVINPFIITR